MKKIVFTVTNDLTYDQRMQRICSTLAENGYDVTLVGFLKKRSVKTESRNFKQVRLQVFFKKGKLFYVEYNFRLFWWLLFHSFDMYCGIDLDTLLPVFIISRLKRKICMYDAHEYFTELPEIIHRPLIRKFWIGLERFLLPRIKYNYTVGNAIANVLSSKYKQKFEVIRNVPVLHNAFTGQPEERNYILYQGALNQGRGLENLMLAMADIDAELYIAGEGDLSVELREYASKLAHAKKIRFLGYIRPAELLNYTNNAKLGMNLVENRGLSYYYSLSNKFFDYIHAGKPQVSMNFPEYKELNDVYHVARLIDDTKPETIANAVNELLKNPLVYEDLKKNTVSAKAELNWQKESIKLIQFYESIGR